MMIDRWEDVCGYASWTDESKETVKISLPECGWSSKFAISNIFDLLCRFSALAKEEKNLTGKQIKEMRTFVKLDKEGIKQEKLETKKHTEMKEAKEMTLQKQEIENKEKGMPEQVKAAKAEKAVKPAKAQKATNPKNKVTIRTLNGEPLRKEYTALEAAAITHAAKHVHEGEEFTGIPSSKEERYRKSPANGMQARSKRKVG